MNRTPEVVAVLAVLAFAGHSWAQSPDAPASPQPARSAVADDDLGKAPAAKRYDPTRIVCRKVKPKTGSRVVRDKGDERICLTQAEWDRHSDLAQESLKERDRGVCGFGCGPGR